MHQTSFTFLIYILCSFFPIPYCSSTNTLTVISLMLLNPMVELYLKYFWLATFVNKNKCSDTVTRQFLSKAKFRKVQCSKSHGQKAPPAFLLRACHWPVHKQATPPLRLNLHVIGGCWGRVDLIGGSWAGLGRGLFAKLVWTEYDKKGTEEMETGKYLEQMWCSSITMLIWTVWKK